jgi:AcrR family transcriptional regulator
MADGTSPRKPRADGARNRAELLLAARKVMDKKGADATLDEIAKAAGVGIGTLYRHFPTRAALYEDLYREALEQLAHAAEGLAQGRTGLEALRLWVVEFIDYLSAKRLIAQVLQRMPKPDAGTVLASQTTAMAVAQLCAVGLADGSIRAGTRAEDVTRLVLALAQGFGEPGWREGTLRVLDILIAGLAA